MRKILFILPIVFLFSCEDEEDIEISDFKGLWNNEWKQCDLYFGANEGSINFVFNDTIDNIGTIKEFILDTLITTSFRFEFTDTKTLVIDSIYTPNSTSDWIGTHKLSEVTSKNFVLKRSVTQCENELYKFSK